MRRLPYLFLYCAILLPQAIAGQRQTHGVVTDVSQERIYLQTDKPYYASGDTVWMRVHLMDAATNVPVHHSRFVYVELHDQQADTLMQRIMIRSDDDGVFANMLLLPKTLKGGVYTLVAYTQWMRNFPTERFCYQPLTVVGEQRVRGHQIPTELLAKYDDVKVTVSGTAATDRLPMTLDIGIHDRDGHPLSGIFALSVTDYNVVKPDSLFGDIRQSLLRQQFSDTPALPESIIYPYQQEQFITGRVKGTLKKNIRNPHLLVVNCQTAQRWEFELGDSTRFALAVDNPEGSTFLLEGTRRSGRTAFVELQIDSLTFPKPTLPHYTLAESPNLSAFRTQAQTQQMYSRADYIELPEVTKVGKKREIQRANFLNIEAPRGIPEGDPRLERAATMRQLLISLGMRVYNDGANSYISTPNNTGVMLYVDNIREEDHDYVLNIVPTDIKSIEYFTPNNAINGFFGARPASFSGKVPGVLFVFLKDGSERFRSPSSRPLSMATVHQLGYRPSVEFHSPQYSDIEHSTRPDHRTTLYWNPKVKTDDNGQATIRFYASDISRRYLITLEGICDDGTIVHHQQVIE